MTGALTELPMVRSVARLRQAEKAESLGPRATASLKSPSKQVCLGMRRNMRSELRRALIPFPGVSCQTIPDGAHRRDPVWLHGLGRCQHLWQ